MSKTKTRGIAIVVISAIGVLFGPVSHAKLIATEEFEDGSTRPVSIVVLPAQVQLVKQRLMRQEAQIEESGELEAHLTSAVVAEFQARGYDVSAIDADAIAADPSLQEIFVDASRRFTEMLANLEGRISKSKNVKRRRYNAGDEVKLLASRLGVDAIALARMQIIVPAAGVRALNFGLGGETAIVSVTIVDGTSGDVEAYVTLPALQRGKMFGGHDEIIENAPEQMANYAAGTLESLPDADPSLRTETSEDDVISDLESLLE